MFKIPNIKFIWKGKELCPPLTIIMSSQGYLQMHRQRCPSLSNGNKAVRKRPQVQLPHVTVYTLVQLSSSTLGCFFFLLISFRLRNCNHLNISFYNNILILATTKILFLKNCSKFFFEKNIVQSYFVNCNISGQRVVFFK